MAADKQWNWQQRDWPHFTYDEARMEARERGFLHRAGLLLGATMHIKPDEQQALLIERMSDEALNTSEIEGETLNRESVQSSIRRRLGLATNRHAVGAAEAGIAEMMVDLYQRYHHPLSHDTLYGWHAMIMNGRRDIDFVGGYRQHKEPMQVVSGRLDVPTVHFEAPLSKRVYKEMERFIAWFNGSTSLPPLTRASIAHLYFESIHPFEDGNGRIGRCLVEKALAQSLGRPIMTGLSHVIYVHRKQYYAMLEQSNKSNQIDEWLAYFADTILEAQTFSTKLVEFIIHKTHFYDRFRGSLNQRQQKVIARMFREGNDGFKGGLSADNYITITGTSRATATRDLSDLVNQGAFTKTGAGKGTRYALHLSL
jgi:Fic family protein